MMVVNGYQTGVFCEGENRKSLFLFPYFTIYENVTSFFQNVPRKGGESAKNEKFCKTCDTQSLTARGEVAERAATACRGPGKIRHLATATASFCFICV